MGSKRNQEPVSPTNWQLRNAVFAAAFAVLVSFAYCVVRGVGLPSGKAASNHVELKSEVGTSPSTSLNVEWEQIGRRACGIKYASHFLSEAEVDHILRVIDESGGWEASPTGGPEFELPRDLRGSFLSLVQTDPVFEAVNQRIAVQTGVRAHAKEDPFALARIRSRGNTTRGGFFAPFGLHHDSDTRPFRVRTVIVYLTNATGGRTAFPLCGAEHDRTSSKDSGLKSTPLPAPVSEAARQKSHQQLHVHEADFEAGLAANFGGLSRGFSRQVSFDVNVEHPFNDIIEATCRGLYGASVDVRRGSALMFDSMLEPFHDHDANPLTWHAGCNVLAGEKVILQKFKEMVPEDRKLEKLKQD
eukprot:INCI15201.1.p1 GENE.INCI15201.1~~INCI15201.1.p1  ORF type:complete len:358 (+),score=48.87 INCI15201.1:92-1165(+)